MNGVLAVGGAGVKQILVDMAPVASRSILWFLMLIRYTSYNHVLKLMACILLWMILNFSSRRSQPFHQSTSYERSHSQAACIGRYHVLWQSAKTNNSLSYPKRKLHPSAHERAMVRSCFSLPISRLVLSGIEMTGKRCISLAIVYVVSSIANSCPRQAR